MRVSYQWLSEYVDLNDVTPERLAELLTSGGLTVDAVTTRNQGVEGVVVGAVLACEQHSNADRLKVCQVDAGTGEILQIVCGAANVRAGVRVPVALVGAKLPGGVEIKRAKLRGVESSGMLCSAKELGLEVRLLPTEQTSGLFLLPEDTPIGQSIVDALHLDDAVLDLDLTPNRGDCLSMRGLAYEVAALLGRRSHFEEKAEGHHLDVSDTPQVRVRIESSGCHAYAGQVLQLTGNHQPSPLWMQMRLLAAGIRPIDAIVDVTNYVMLEWGQPLHAFDFATVEAGQIIVRDAEQGELIETLDGQKRVLAEGMTLIADPKKALGIAGVMGGANSEISVGSRSVLLESALFERSHVRRTGQKLGLRSEAQQRFERGVDPAVQIPALKRAVALLQQIVGATPQGGVCQVTSDSMPSMLSHEVCFSPARCNQALGTSFQASEMRNVFSRLGFTVIGQGETENWRIMVPSRRADIQLEADLVEEVARLCGYDAIPATLPMLANAPGRVGESYKLQKMTRSLFTSCGMDEVVTYAFGHPESISCLRLPENHSLRQSIPLLLPMSEERSHLRRHLLPSLAQVALYNLNHGVKGGAIFEISRVFHPYQLPIVQQPEERHSLGALWFGHMDIELGRPPRAYTFFDAKGVLEYWLMVLGLQENLQFTRSHLPWLHPGRSADILVNGVTIGSLGELHPETALQLELPRAIWAEIDLTTVVSLPVHAFQVHPVSRQPWSYRDLAVLVDHEVPAESLLIQVRKNALAVMPHLQLTAKIFDVYSGKGIPVGKKSVGISISLGLEDATLDDDSIQRIMDAILQGLRLEYGAELRGQDS